jgi:saccharopine dehydrogenase-like NADP-dependent oxidoreductase
VAAAALLVVVGVGSLIVGRDGRDGRAAPRDGRGLVTAAARAADAENVRALEAAVASTAAALAASPDNVHLERMLERARRQRAEYLQSARALTTDQ